MGLSHLQSLDLSWNPVFYLDAETFKGLHELQTLLLHHCMITDVFFSVFSYIAHLRLLDISHSEIHSIDMGCETDTRIVTILVGYNNVQRVTGASCLKHTSLVVSNQRGFCCLSIFTNLCSTTNPNQNCGQLMGSKMLVFNAYITGIIIVLSNTCALIFNVLRSTLDSVITANLSFAGIVIVFPVFCATRWHLVYGEQFSFYELYLCSGLLYKVIAITVFISAQVSSAIMLLISAYKCYGILKLHRGTSYTAKRYIVLTLSSIWFVWCTLTCALVITASSRNTPSTLGSLFHVNGDIFLFICSLLNLLSCLGVVILYAIVLRVIIKSTKVNYGQKHGQTFNVKALLLRVMSIIVLSVIGIAAPSVTMMHFLLYKSSSHVVTVVIILIFTLHALLNPMVYTLSTGRFRSAFVKCVKERTKPASVSIKTHVQIQMENYDFYQRE